MGVSGGARSSVVEEAGVEEAEGVGGGSAAGVVDEVFEEPRNVDGGENVGGNVTGGAEGVEVPFLGVNSRFKFC